MTRLVERLRQLSADMLRLDLDMKLPAGSIDPSEAADRIEELERQLAETRIGRLILDKRIHNQRAQLRYWEKIFSQHVHSHKRHTLPNYLGMLKSLYSKGYSRGIEDAAKVAESCYNPGDWLDRDHAGKAVAIAIRALSDSTPTPLQEQNANMGKEGEP